MTGRALLVVCLVMSSACARTKATERLPKSPLVYESTRWGPWTTPHYIRDGRRYDDLIDAVQPVAKAESLAESAKAWGTATLVLGWFTILGPSYAILNSRNYDKQRRDFILRIAGLTFYGWLFAGPYERAKQLDAINTYNAHQWEQRRTPEVP